MESSDEYKDLRTPSQDQLRYDRRQQKYGYFLAVHPGQLGQKHHQAIDDSFGQFNSSNNISEATKFKIWTKKDLFENSFGYPRPPERHFSEKNRFRGWPDSGIKDRMEEDRYFQNRFSAHGRRAGREALREREAAWTDANRDYGDLRSQAVDRKRYAASNEKYHHTYQSYPGMNSNEIEQPQYQASLYSDGRNPFSTSPDYPGAQPAAPLTKREVYNNARQNALERDPWAKSEYAHQRRRLEKIEGQENARINHSNRRVKNFITPTPSRRSKMDAEENNGEDDEEYIEDALVWRRRDNAEYLISAAEAEYRERARREAEADGWSVMSESESQLGGEWDTMSSYSGRN